MGGGNGFQQRISAEIDLVYAVVFYVQPCGKLLNLTIPRERIFDKIHCLRFGPIKARVPPLKETFETKSALENFRAAIVRTK